MNRSFSRVQFVTKTGKRVSFSPAKKSKSRRPKSAAQKKHLARAKKAMNLYKSGQAKTLKAAWRMV